MEPRYQSAVGLAHPVALLVGIGAIASSVVLGSLGNQARPNGAVLAPEFSAPPIETVQASTDPAAMEPKHTLPRVLLSRGEVGEVQAWLRAFGVDPGPIDGIPGP